MDDDKNIEIDFSILEDEKDRQTSTISNDRVRRRQKIPFNVKLPRKILIWGGVVIVFIIFVTALMSGDNSDLSKNDVTALQAKLERIEERIESLTADNERSSKLLKQEMDGLKQRVDGLQRRVDSSLTKSVQRTSAIQPSVSSGAKRYHKVRRGENLTLIARKYGLTVRELCTLNTISPNHSIHPGQKLVISSKN